MTGAIGVAPYDRKTAIGEVLLRRVAERPSALDLSDLREADAPHVAYLSRGEDPSVCPPALAGNGRNAASSAGARPSPRNLGGKPLRARRLPNRGRVCPAVELDPDPIGFADHRAARGRPERGGNPSRASPLERQSPQRFDRLFCPHPRPPLSLSRLLELPAICQFPLNATAFPIVYPSFQVCFKECPRQLTRSVLSLKSLKMECRCFLKLINTHLDGNESMGPLGKFPKPFAIAVTAIPQLQKSINTTFSFIATRKW